VLVGFVFGFRWCHREQNQKRGAAIKQREGSSTPSFFLNDMFFVCEMPSVVCLDSKLAPTAAKWNIYTPRTAIAIKQAGRGATDLGFVVSLLDVFAMDFFCKNM
jgi:hypothetical protein